MSYKIFIKTAILGAFLAVPLFVAPQEARASGIENILDPLCLFRNCDTPSTVNNTVTNSNNVNSNVNSPGGVVSGNTAVVGTPTIPVVIPTTSVPNPYVVQTPVYVYGSNQPYSQLQVTCYSIPTRAARGETVIWRASAFGGNGNYYYSWSGTDGLSGNGSSVSTNYGSSGTKNATIYVVSGNQTISQNCGNSVEIYGDYYNNAYYDNNNYHNNNYYYDNSYNNLSANCSVNVSTSYLGNSVTWNAYASGGNGYYSFEWSGTGALSGTGSSINVRYNDVGQKYAQVTVRSGNRIITQSCSNSVSVYSGSSFGGYDSYAGSLTATCAADRSSARVGTPVTWTVYPSGGNGQYAYQWNGSDGLVSPQKSVAIGYTYAGTKTGSVTISSAGQSVTRSCGSVEVSGASVSGVAKKKAPSKPVATVTKPEKDSDNDSALSASSILSFKNVPWGFVAILVILVLFGTVVYLVMNKNKI